MYCQFCDGIMNYYVTLNRGQLPFLGDKIKASNTDNIEVYSCRCCGEIKYKIAE